MFSVLALILVASVLEVFTGSPPGVLILSFDGFHPDYVTSENTPHLYNELLPIGAGPPYMHSIFPTKTMSTHFSMSTGVYPETHGVYSNDVFSDDNYVLFYGQTIFQRNKALVPIWTENQKLGNSRHTGVMMWPGSDFEYHQTMPTYIQTFDVNLKWEDRATKIVEWMTSATDKANFVMAYFEDTPCKDKTLREAQFREHFKKIDETIKKIYTDLKTPISNGNIQLIIMSDHGTQEVYYENIMIIENYIDSHNNYYVLSGPIVFIKPISNPAEVLKSLTEHEDNDWKYTVYSKDTFEDHQKMNTDQLIGVIILLAKSGYTFTGRLTLENYVSEVGSTENLVLHENGYDIYNTKMNGFFLGIGNKFKDKIFTLGPFNLIDVYPLLKLLLELPAEASTQQNNLRLNSVVLELLEPGVADSFKSQHQD